MITTVQFDSKSYKTLIDAKWDKLVETVHSQSAKIKASVPSVLPPVAMGISAFLILPACIALSYVIIAGAIVAAGLLGALIVILAVTSLSLTAYIAYSFRKDEEKKVLSLLGDYLKDNQEAILNNLKDHTKVRIFNENEYDIDGLHRDYFTIQFDEEKLALRVLDNLERNIQNDSYLKWPANFGCVIRDGRLELGLPKSIP